MPSLTDGAGDAGWDGLELSAPLGERRLSDQQMKRSNKVVTGKHDYLQARKWTSQ